MEKEKKSKIVKILKSLTVPTIKSLGFFGTFPHFRRNKNDRYEFLSFQFNRYGGSFIIEVGFVAPDKLLEWAKALPFQKLNYGNTRAENRLRIQPDNESGDFWFKYNDFTKEEQFKELAELVTTLLPKVEQFLN